jgi:hypothetical protein
MRVFAAADASFVDPIVVIIVLSCLRQE